MLHTLLGQMGVAYAQPGNQKESIPLSKCHLTFHRMSCSPLPSLLVRVKGRTLPSTSHHYNTGLTSVNVFSLCARLRLVSKRLAIWTISKLATWPMRCVRRCATLGVEQVASGLKHEPPE